MAPPHNLARRLSQDFCPNSKFGKRRNPVLVNSRRNPRKRENRCFLKRLSQRDFAKSRWGSPLSVHKKRIPAGTPPVTGFASFRDPITGCKHNTNILVLPAGLPQSVLRIDYVGIVPSYGNTAQRIARRFFRKNLPFPSFLRV